MGHLRLGHIARSTTQVEHRHHGDEDIELGNVRGRRNERPRLGHPLQTPCIEFAGAAHHLHDTMQKTVGAGRMLPAYLIQGRCPVPGGIVPGRVHQVVPLAQEGHLLVGQGLYRGTR